MIDLRISGEQQQSPQNYNIINKVGEWFTPTRVGQILRYILDPFSYMFGLCSFYFFLPITSFITLPSVMYSYCRDAMQEHNPDCLWLYLAKDGVVYKDSIISACTKPHTDPEHIHQPKEDSNIAHVHKHNSNSNSNSSDEEHSFVPILRSSNPSTNETIENTTRKSSPVCNVLDFPPQKEDDCLHCDDFTNDIAPNNETRSDNNNSANTQTSNPDTTTTTTTAKTSNDPFWYKGVIILIPLRLGIEQHINKVYISQLKNLFHWPQSLGIIGGRPRQSLYFVGYQGLIIELFFRYGRTEFDSRSFV